MTGNVWRGARTACLGFAVLAGIGLAGYSVSAIGAEPSAPAKPTTASEGTIFERQFIMQQLDDDGELLGNILAGIEPTDKLAATTRAIAKGARESMVSFRAEVPGGRSKAEVWSNHADFMQRMEAFTKGAEDMAKAGEIGDVTEVTRLMDAAMPCKACHDVYRAPKKPAA